jgi:hypothetical protein
MNGYEEDRIAILESKVEALRVAVAAMDIKLTILLDVLSSLDRCRHPEPPQRDQN